MPESEFETLTTLAVLAVKAAEELKGELRAETLSVKRLTAVIGNEESGHRRWTGLLATRLDRPELLELETKHVLVTMLAALIDGHEGIKESIPRDRDPSVRLREPRECATSSTSSTRNPTSPRRSHLLCPTTRDCAHSRCAPTTSPTTTASTTNPTPATRSNPVTTTTNKTTATESDSVRQRLRDVGLYGLAAQDHALVTEPWVERVIDIEDRERKRRSLERRLTNARIGAFKPIADFD